MCMNPSFVMWNAKTNKYQFQGMSKHCSDFKDKPALVVPCGKCPECRSKWRTELAQRVRWELQKYKNNCCFLTLTVNKECLNEVFPNGSLKHEYFQLFMKRLRRHLEYNGFKGKIKYLMCGEYGHDNGRPHFHAILFGYRPDDLKYDGSSQKGYVQYTCDMLQKLWKKVGASQKEIDDFNNDPANKYIIKRNGGKFDYLPLGFIKVSTNVTEHTAPYMVKYMVKYAEIKQDEFEVNGQQVKKPYLVYPKTRLGIDYFIEHIDQIMNNGFILDSRGQKQRIPRSFLKFLENSEDIEYQNYFELYKIHCEEFIRERREILVALGYETFGEQYAYELEQGEVRRKIYEQFKNKNR